MKKRRFPRRSIENVRDEGQVTPCLGLFLVLFLSTLLVSYLQMEMIRSSSRYLEDALAASGLASALIDVREYGSTHVVRIPDGTAAYERYCGALRANLGLDEKWECENGKLISGQVKLENYTIYNVSGERVEACRLDRGREEWFGGKKGEIYAPNGQLVERTGVYGEISYPVKGILGLTVTARKGKLVDIVGEK